MSVKPSCDCGTCGNCRSRQYMREVRSGVRTKGPRRRVKDDTVFRGTFTKVRLRLTLEDVWGMRGNAHGDGIGEV